MSENSLARPRVALSARLTPKLGDYGWIWLATAGIFALSAIVAPGTVRWTSVNAMLPFAGILAIVAVGQTLIIQQRGLDMSATGMISLGGFFATKLYLVTGSVALAIPVALLIATALGALNGTLVSTLKIAPIVATLAFNAILLGLVRTLSGGSPLSASGPIETFSHFRAFGLPCTTLLAIAFVILAGLIIQSTVIGRRFVAVGANPAAALAGGIPVGLYQLSTYAAGAFCFAFAGILFSGFIGSASPSAGADYLLPGIAAVVVGGTPFTGGRGSVLASGVAALFMTQLGQMVLALGADTATQLLVQAGVIVLATSIRRLPELSRKWLGKREPTSR